MNTDVPGMTFKQRVLAFWAKVNQNGPVSPHHPEMSNCWIWDGCKTYDGYGTFCIQGSREKQHNVLAHQVSFFLAGGGWPTMQIDHICHVPSCVRPDHLRHVSQQENAKYRIVKECKYGHPLADPNLYYYGIKRRLRRCRACLGMPLAESKAI